MEKTTAIMKNYLKETGLDRPGMEEQPLFRNPRGENSHGRESPTFWANIQRHAIWPKCHLTR